MRPEVITSRYQPMNDFDWKKAAANVTMIVSLGSSERRRPMSELKQTAFLITTALVFLLVVALQADQQRISPSPSQYSKVLIDG